MTPIHHRKEKEYCKCNHEIITNIGFDECCPECELPSSPATKGEKCVFCAMTFPDAEVLNIEPLNPVVEGHRIFIPKEHATDFADNEQAVIKTMYAVHQYAKKVGGEFNIITSKGKSATQSVFHLHVHFVPRKENDGLALPWTGQKKFPSPADTEGWEKELEDGFAFAYEPLGISMIPIKSFIRSLIHSAEERGRQGRIKEEKIIFDALVDTALAAREDEIRNIVCEGCKTKI